MDNISSGDTLKPSGGDIDPKKTLEEFNKLPQDKRNWILEQIAKEDAIKKQANQTPNQIPALTQQQKDAKIKEIIDKFKQEFKREPTPEEITDQMFKTFLPNQIPMPKKEVPQDIVNKAVEELKKKNGGRAPTSKELEQYLDNQQLNQQPIPSFEEFKEILEIQRQSFIKINGREPTNKELNNFVKKNFPNAPQKISKKLMNKAMRVLKKNNNGQDPSTEQIEQYLNKTLLKQQKHKQVVQAAKQHLKDKNGGKEPTKEELNRYLQINHPKLKPNQLPPKTIARAVVKYKQQNGGKSPTPEQLAQYLEKLFPDRKKNNIKGSDLKLPHPSKSNKQQEEQKVNGLSQKQILKRIGKSVLQEALGREPTKIELNEWINAERAPAKFGQISGSEVQRVEELLRRQNGGREPSAQDLQNYFQTNGISPNHVAYPAIEINQISSNAYIYGFVLLAVLVYWIRQQIIKSQQEADGDFKKQNSSGLLDSFKSYFQKKKKDDEDDFDHVL